MALHKHRTIGGHETQTWGTGPGQAAGHNITSHSRHSLIISDQRIVVAGSLARHIDNELSRVVVSLDTMVTYITLTPIYIIVLWWSWTY